MVSAPIALVLVIALFTSASPQSVLAKTEEETTTTELPAAGEFAERFVSTWVETDRDSAARLEEYIQVPDGVDWPDAPVARASEAEVSDADRSGGVWSVVVGIDVVDSSDDTAARRYYQVPVDYQDGALVALTLPTPVPAPPTAEAPEMAYPNDVALDSPVGNTVASYLNAYLTGSGDLSRFTSPGADIHAISPAPYTSVKATAISTDVDLTVLPDQPDDGTQARLLVTATTTTAGGGAIPVQYALTTQTRDGRWEVAEVDPTPDLETQPTTEN